ncbi:hypothetical protein ACFX13_046735 [Malus domestica]
MNGSCRANYSDYCFFYSRFPIFPSLYLSPRLFVHPPFHRFNVALTFSFPFNFLLSRFRSFLSTASILLQRFIPSSTVSFLLHCESKPKIAQPPDSATFSKFLFTEVHRKCVQIQEKKNCDDPQEQRKPEDLRIPFERFGPVKDVYLPKNYYTGEPRGFGFVKYRFGEDAVEAKQQLNHTVIGGREIRIVFAEENRKTAQEMRTTARVSSRHGGSSRRRTPPRSPRRQYCCRF